MIFLWQGSSKFIPIDSAIEIFRIITLFNSKLNIREEFKSGAGSWNTFSEGPGSCS